MRRGRSDSVVRGVVSRLRSLWEGLRRRAEIEEEMVEEFRHHVELRAADLVRRGVAPEEAARRARIEFGHVESHREAARVSRGLRWFDRMRFSWLDVKLGLRMLRKYPGLSMVSVVGMSVAIAIGAGVFGALGTVTDPSLPLAEGERVVSIQNWDARANGPDRQSVYDFLLWREELTSVRDLGAFRTLTRNMIVEGGPPTLVHIAEMTASGFRVARVPPILGRPLLVEDEHEGAPAVVVIAYEEWQTRFGADPEVVGRTIRLGGGAHTVVGVMPAGFRFPVSHRYWVPLRLNASDWEAGGGPAIDVFGRLAGGATLDRARSELATIGLRRAAELPATHERLRPRVLPYAQAFLGMGGAPAAAWMLRGIRVAVSMLLILVAVNVAVLVYARTATRTAEIAVRSALGASRRRIVMQLFMEAFVLSAVAAAAGLAFAGIGLAALQALLQPDDLNRLGQVEDVPFWLEFGLSAELVAYVAALAVLAGVIVGVLPALKSTGRRVQTGLQQLSTRGSQMQLGRTWTVLIIAQVAVAVAVLPFGGYLAGQSVRRAVAEAGYPTDEILRARLVLGSEEGMQEATADDPALHARFLDRAGTLVRRLEAEPAVSGVTFQSRLPGYPYERFEAEGGGRDWVYIKRVDVDLFTVFDIGILAGRGFIDADGRRGSSTVLVNRVFAERLFGGGNVVGRRIRRSAVWGPDTGAAVEESGPWLEIVGVVPDFGVQLDIEPPDAILYEPRTLAEMAPPVLLSVRVRGPSSPAFAPRLRELAAAVDPALQLHQLTNVAESERQARQILGFIALATTAVVLSVVLLSAAGIYAMMSFTVARRRREIGIRVALGADRRRILTGIFARASAQLGAGVAVGLVLAAFTGGPLAVGSGPLEGNGLIMLPLVAALMMTVGLLAALGPARRGLAIQPTEALREE